jgi:hypothetical protein
MDSAKWTLPPIVPLLVAAVLVAIVVSVVVFSNKTKPSASLAITKVVSAAQEGNTMVAVQTLSITGGGAASDHGNKV